MIIIIIDDDDDFIIYCFFYADQKFIFAIIANNKKGPIGLKFNKDFSY